MSAANRSAMPLGEIDLLQQAARTRRKGFRLLPSVPWVVPVLFALLLVVGLAGRWIAPLDPGEIDLISRFQPPLENWDHILGTDQLGRDVLSRMLTGAALSMTLAALVIVFAATIGLAVGMIAGFFGGRTDTVLMRLTDAMLAIPAIMLALLLVAVLGPGFWNVVIALLLVTWARYARFVRGEVLALRSREFVEASIVCGTHPLKILWRHFLPNIVNSVIVVLTLDVGRIILLESSLAFLGLGLPPDSGAWGSTISEGKAYLQIAPWIALVPACAMMVTILLANSFGNWLSDLLNPRLRRAAQ
jgi:peptide/nickel transport system permease protein